MRKGLPVMMRPSATFTPAKRLPWSALPKVLRDHKAVPVRFPLPLHHTTVAMPVKGRPQGWSARVLILELPDGRAEVFSPLIHYMIANHNLCATWQNSLARALGLFWDYCQAHSADGKGTYQFDADLFEGFVLAARDGTMIDGRDDSGLHWASTSRNQLKLMVSRMLAFSRWCEAKGYADVVLGVETSSFAPAGPAKSAVWSRLQQVGVFAHLRDPAPVRHHARNGFGANPSGPQVQPVKSFPKDRAGDLLEFGHRRPGRPRSQRADDVYNIRDQMMALLDGWGGLRRSEGLHLWFDDVEYDPETKRARVILGHPVWHEKLWGQEGRPVSLRRLEILNRFYQLRPRNMVMRGRYHVGWKGMALNGKHYDQVHWRDHDKGAKFIELYDIYVSRVRPRMMEERRMRGGYDHPFLFVSEVHSDSEEGGIGAPYSMQAYERNHAAAVVRIGLEHAKDRGTTTHGLRHMYGRDLMRRNLPPQYIKQGLHHCTFMAQAPYTVLDLEESSEVIAQGHGRIEFGEGAIPERHGSRNSQLIGRLADEIRGGPRHA